MLNTGNLKVDSVGDRDVVLTRVFDAPGQAVFDALTKPEMLNRWFGPRGYGLSVCEVDLREGGDWRFVIDGPDGSKMVMYGTYQEIAPPNRLVHSEMFGPDPEEQREADGDSASLVSTVLVEEDGKTTMRATVTYATPEVRTMVLESGMEHGAAESYDKLAELLAEG